MDRNRIIKRLKDTEIVPDGRRTVYTVQRELGRGGNGAAFALAGGRGEQVVKFYIPPDARDLDDSAYKRFQREVELASRLSHPYVIRAQGVGVAPLGSYKLPYYVMPKAGETLRSLIPDAANPDVTMRNVRVWLRACLGVSYLHHLGIVHRDLKPENILLFPKSRPRISDFGIAQVAPGFVEWSQLTVKEERLLNRDYYAPEQRFGDATEVDHRADIYALGCILYELVSGIAPVRPSMPSLREVSDELKPLESIFRKMTAHVPARRYPHLESVIEDTMWAVREMGVAQPAATGMETTRQTLRKCLLSKNAAIQMNAMTIAEELGDESLPILHECTGHRRVDVACAAYGILGELRREESLRVLVAGLYGIPRRRELDFPVSEAASRALSQCTDQQRLRALSLIKKKVRPKDLDIVIGGLDTKEVYARLLYLYEEGLLYHGFAGEGLALLVRVNSERAWPLVRDKMKSRHGLYNWVVTRYFLPHFEAARQAAIVDHLVSTASGDSMEEILDAIPKTSLPTGEQLRGIEDLVERARTEIRKDAERKAFLKKARDLSDELMRYEAYRSE